MVHETRATNRNIPLCGEAITRLQGTVEKYGDNTGLSRRKRWGKQLSMAMNPHFGGSKRRVVEGDDSFYGHVPSQWPDVLRS
jgi:hypothetical protein